MAGLLRQRATSYDAVVLNGANLVSPLRRDQMSLCPQQLHPLELRRSVPQNPNCSPRKLIDTSFVTGGGSEWPSFTISDMASTPAATERNGRAESGSFIEAVVSVGDNLPEEHSVQYGMTGARNDTGAGEHFSGWARLPNG